MQSLEYIRNLQTGSEVYHSTFPHIRDITIEHEDPYYRSQLTPLLPFLGMLSVKLFYSLALDEDEEQCVEPDCPLYQFNVTQLTLHGISLYGAVQSRFMPHLPFLLRLQFMLKENQFIPLSHPSLLEALDPIRLFPKDLSMIICKDVIAIVKEGIFSRLLG